MRIKLIRLAVDTICLGISFGLCILMVAFASGRIG